MLLSQDLEPEVNTTAPLCIPNSTWALSDTGESGEKIGKVMLWTRVRAVHTALKLIEHHLSLFLVYVNHGSFSSVWFFASESYGGTAPKKATLVLSTCGRSFILYIVWQKYLSRCKSCHPGTHLSSVYSILLGHICEKKPSCVQWQWIYCRSFNIQQILLNEMSTYTKYERWKWRVTWKLLFYDVTRFNCKRNKTWYLGFGWIKHLYYNIVWYHLGIVMKIGSWVIYCLCL